jgi:hypothetical protein
MIIYNVNNSWDDEEKETKFIIDSMIMKVLLMHQQYLAKRNRERVRLC